MPNTQHKVSSIWHQEKSFENYIYITRNLNISVFVSFFPFINRTKLDINGASEMDTPRKFHNNLDTRSFFLPKIDDSTNVSIYTQLD